MALPLTISKDTKMSLLQHKVNVRLVLPVTIASVGAEVPVHATFSGGDGKSAAAQVRLLYRNTYRRTVEGWDSTTSNKRTTREVPVDTATVAIPPSGGTVELTLTLPHDAPPSASGAVEWVVDVGVQRRHARDVHAEADLIVVAPPEAYAELAAAPPFSTADWPMLIELSRRAVRPGDVIAGRLTFTPGVSLRARRVRVDLRRETKHEAYTERHVEASTDLCGRGELAARVTESLPFTTVVPADAEPTFVAEHNEQHWYLDGVIDLPRARDVRVSVELVVASALRAPRAAA